MSQVKTRWNTTLNAGENQIHGFIYAIGFLWGVTQTVPAKFIKFDPSNQTWTTLTFANDGNHKRAGDVIYIASKGKLYVILQTTTHPLIVIAEVDPTTLATTDVVSDSASGFRNDVASPGSLTTDGTYLYCTASRNADFAPSVLKYDLASFTFQSSATIGGTNPHTLRFDGSKLYLTEGSAPGNIYRFDPATMAQEDGQALTADNPTDDLAFTSDSVWVGFEGPTQIGQICKVLKADLTNQTYIDPGIGSGCFGVFNDGKYILAVFNVNGGSDALARIHPESLAVRTFSFPPGQNVPNEIQQDATLLYFTFYLSPAQISAVRTALVDRKFLLT